MVATSNGHSTMTTEYSGRVIKVNERGVLFEGKATWTNISKFAGSVELPNVGDTVTAKIDGSGFIREIRPVGPVKVAEAAPVAESPQDRSIGAQVSRETSIIRMNVLSHATAFVTACGGTVDDLIGIAEQLEVWVTR